MWRLVAALVSLLAIVFGVGGVTEAHAQSGLTFTVTPPLFNLNLQEGENWTSGIQVVNGNPYDITVYAEPMLFRPSGEEGRPDFYVPDQSAAGESLEDRSNLAGWITVPRNAHTIPREQTVVIPIAIDVPLDAAPGGHYAAVLIGNRPPQGASEGGTVNVASSIASLIFLRVAGDIDERGRIRDFVTAKSLYQDAQAYLSLRFENQGNVHLQPQGDITIFNMFGKKRGYIPVNHASGYGNVLPGSMRTFAFTWKSDTGSWDIGRYRAEVTLGYGAEDKQFAQSTVYFWVLPLVPLLQVLTALIAFVWFFGWAVRTYVRRALAMESLRRMAARDDALHDAADSSHTNQAVRAEPVATTRTKIETLVRPLQEGMVDLRSAAEVATEPGVGVGPPVAAQKPGASLLRKYRLFFVFVVVVAIAWFAASAFFADVLTFERDYQVTEERRDGSSRDLDASAATP